ncbi:hypothetical protein ACO0QE_004685 [Hanseniaspora vineae]
MSDTRAKYYEKVWIDGCFDFTHFGHCMAILQTKRLFPELKFNMFERCSNGEKNHSTSDNFAISNCSANSDDNSDSSDSSDNSDNSDNSEQELIIGIHNDKDIMHNKNGHPVMHEEERYYHISQVRWCTAIFKDAPYVTEPSVMDSQLCQYVVHGDDIVLDANGEDCYTKVRKVGRFKMVKRTEGVSTTEIIHRILTFSEGDFSPDHSVEGKTQDSIELDSSYTNHPFAKKLAQHGINVKMLEDLSSDVNGFDPWCFVYYQNFYQTVLKGGFEFSEGKTVVFIDDLYDFDLFHAGDIEVIKYVKEEMYLGYAMILGVGLQDDVSENFDKNIKPKMINTLSERCYNVLSYKPVDGLIVMPQLHLLYDVPIVRYSEVLAIITENTSEHSLHFAHLGRDSIIKRVHQDRQQYIARNIKKGIAY